MANSNGAKAFGGIMAVGALLAAVVAVMRPMAQRITHMEAMEAAQSARWEKEIDRWLAKANNWDAWIGEHDRRIEARDASQWERIKSLERLTFGKAAPITHAPGEEP